MTPKRDFDHSRFLIRLFGKVYENEVIYFAGFSINSVIDPGP